jgi:hypothetical protein
VRPVQLGFVRRASSTDNPLGRLSSRRLPLLGQRQDSGPFQRPDRTDATSTEEAGVVPGEPLHLPRFHAMSMNRGSKPRLPFWLPTALMVTVIRSSTIWPARPA